MWHLPKTQCFQRITARRGHPGHIILNDGKNFVAEETPCLKSILKVEWHFYLLIYYWGFFEIHVQSVKELLKKELQRANHEELQTVLFEIEMFIKNRPLNYIYPTDLEACLTPSHLLFGRYHVRVNKLFSIQ